MVFGWRVAAVAVGAGVVAIGGLEANLRVSVCDVRGEDTVLPVLPDAAEERARRGEAIEVLRATAAEELAVAMQASSAVLIVYVDPAQIAGLNGIALHRERRAFVRNDLSDAARRYVTFHETLHLVDPRSSEFEVNVHAAELEPLGMVATAGGSIASVLSGQRSWSCKLASLWSAFKYYFLPFQQEG